MLLSESHMLSISDNHKVQKKTLFWNFLFSLQFIYFLLTKEKDKKHHLHLNLVSVISEHKQQSLPISPVTDTDKDC